MYIIYITLWVADGLDGVLPLFLAVHNHMEMIYIYTESAAHHLASPASREKKNSNGAQTMLGLIEMNFERFKVSSIRYERGSSSRSVVKKSA